MIGNSYIIHENEKLFVTISIGATLVNEDDAIDSLIKRADTLLYKSKEGGRNCLTIGLMLSTPIGFNPKKRAPRTIGLWLPSWNRLIGYGFGSLLSGAAAASDVAIETGERQGAKVVIPVPKDWGG